MAAAAASVNTSADPLALLSGQAKLAVSNHGVCRGLVDQLVENIKKIPSADLFSSPELKDLPPMVLPLVLAGRLGMMHTAAELEVLDAWKKTGSAPADLEPYLDVAKLDSSSCDKLRRILDSEAYTTVLAEMLKRNEEELRAGPREPRLPQVVFEASRLDLDRRRSIG